MPVHLLKTVQRELVPELAPLGFAIVAHTGSRWTSETVELQCLDLRIRISFERGWFEVHFGIAQDPFTWFSCYEVLERMGYASAALSGTDAGETIQRLKSFVRAEIVTLLSLFSVGSYEATRIELMEVRREMNNNLMAQRPAPWDGRKKHRR